MNATGQPARFPAARRADPRSFTLTELLLVVLIVALTAALVAPRLGTLGRRIGVSSANYDLLWLLRQARWQAVSTGRTYLVHLRPVAGGYAAEVTRALPGSGGEVPLRAEWARLEQLPGVKTLMQIPPDRGRTRRRELTVRFTPWGVGEDYVIVLDAGTPEMRMEVRRPSGLVHLWPADRPSAFDPDQLSAIREYWQGNCREAAR